MEGMDLILSSLCNGTACKVTYDSPVIDFQVANKADLYKEINGKHLKVGTYANYPLHYVTAGPNGTLNGHGVAFIILRILQMKFNFTYDVVVPRKNFLSGGARPEDSLIGLINSSQVDMAAAFIPKLIPFREAIQFSRDLDEGTWMMMLKRPRASATGSGLTAPFDIVVWYLTLAAVLAYGPCITFLTRLRSKLVRDKENHLPLSPSIWFVYSAFIKQGTNLAPEANATRILFATWWLFIILLSAFYTANLTAFLTLSKFTLDIKDPQDLITKNYRWMSAEGGSVQYVVENRDEKLYYLNKMVLNGRAEFKNYDSISKYLPFVDGGGVLVKEAVSLYKIMFDDYMNKAKQGVSEGDRCTYVIAPLPFMTKSRGFAYPHGSRLEQLFDSVLMYILKGGIIDFHKRKDSPIDEKTSPGSRVCPLDLQSKERQLQNSDLLMTYFILFAGLAAAAAVFVGEVLVKRYLNRKLENPVPKRKSKRSRKKRDESKPPPYDSIYGNHMYKINKTSQSKIINGREYYVYNAGNGETRLIPVRTPSAFLYRKMHI